MATAVLPAAVGPAMMIIVLLFDAGILSTKTPAFSQGSYLIIEKYFYNHTSSSPVIPSSPRLTSSPSSSFS
ncbi:MAG TPA: hypothetical protein PKG90_15905, partial [Chitinophagaceae bacterium]|nr:hypothetical protein [Chitinophagaceae bacterium]